MFFSIIITVFREYETISKSISHIENIFKGSSFEIIVVDGDPQKSTVSKIVKTDSVVTVSSPKGRAHQMNSGAEVAKGDTLLFLHADTIFPEGAPQMITQALNKTEIIGGAFSLKFDSHSKYLKFISWITTLRSRVNRIPYGDQAIFIKKEIFNELGGFSKIPIMEDVDFMKSLKKSGYKIEILKENVTTSARRYEKEGKYLCTVRNRIISLLYFFGLSPETLIKFYNSHK